MPAPSPRRTLRKALEVCAATGILVLVAVLFIPKLVDGYSAQPFDAQRWRQTIIHARHDRHPVRQQMAANLLKSNRLQGLPRSEVQEVLGPPDEGPYSSKDTIGYRLGQYRDSIDTEWLLLTFDSKGRVSGLARVH